MKILSRTVFFTFVLVFFLLPLPGANVYILFNPGCMDRLEYAYGFTPQGQEYVKYHIKISPTEVLIFEVGPENNAPKQNYLSGTPLECNDDRLNKELVYSQRSNDDEVFIVRQLDGGQFQVSKVNASSYFRRDAKGVQYDSWQMAFNHLGGLKEGDNLTPNNATGVNVFYEGLQPYECTEAYVFKQTYEFDPNAYRQRFFIPNIGIVEDRSVPGGTDGIYKLRRINGEPFESYLQKVCQSGMVLNSNFLNGGAANPAAARAGNLTYQGPAYHQVERGETLFSISRTYGVSVDELRTWNNMENTTMVRIGDRLRVLPPEPAAGTGNLAAAAPNQGFSWSGEQPAAAGGNIQPFSPAGNTSLPANDTPSGFTPYTSNAASPAGGIQPFSPGAGQPTTTTKGGDLKPWESTTGSHTVRSGETPALLALRYGYTEDRFRHMNSLGPNDILKVGQVVKTTDCPPAAGNNSNPYNEFTPRSGTTAAPIGTGITPYNNFNYNSSSSLTGNTTSVPATNTPISGQAAGNSIPPTPPSQATNPPPVNPGSSTPHFEPYNGGSTPDFSKLSSDPFSTSTNNPGLYPNTDAGAGASAPTKGNTVPGATLPTYNNPGANNQIQPYNPNQIQPYTPGGAAQPGASQQPSTSTAQPSPFGTPLSPGTNTTPGSTPTYPTNSMNYRTPYTPNNNSQPQSYNTSNANTGAIQPYTPPSGGSTASPSSYKTTHLVREGETLESIAQKYNTNAATLRQINNLNANEILIPYQKLYIN